MVSGFSGVEGPTKRWEWRKSGGGEIPSRKINGDGLWDVNKSDLQSTSIHMLTQ